MRLIIKVFYFSVPESGTGQRCISEKYCISNCQFIVFFIERRYFVRYLFSLYRQRLGLCFGNFFGNNVPELFLILIMNYVFTFLFIPQLALFLGAWLKPLVTIIAVFGITLVCTNTGTLDGVKYFNPMYYMVRMSNDVVSTTEAVAVKASESVFCICMQLILCIMLCLLFALVGAKRMRERDL